MHVLLLVPAIFFLFVCIKEIEDTFKYSTSAVCTTPTVRHKVIKIGGVEKLFFQVKQTF